MLSPAVQRQRPMDHFYDGHHVRLRSRALGGTYYLHADDDGEGVSLHKSRASLNAAWAVHFYHGDDDTPYVLLHSAAYGRYLSATGASASRGCRVALQNYDRRQSEAVRWQPQAVTMGSGDHILLRHVAADDSYGYLRANGKYRRWNKRVSVEYTENVSDMMQWVVEPIPARVGMPALPGPVRARLPEDLSVVMLGRAVAAWQLIRFVRASDDGFYTEEGWSAFHFRGRSAYHLRNELATRVGVSDSDLIMCVRAGRYGRLTPLVVDLPREGHGDTIKIIVIIDGTPASNALRHPDVYAQ